MANAVPLEMIMSSVNKMPMPQNAKILPAAAHVEKGGDRQYWLYEE
jgi:hypothetical protein